MHTMEGQRQNFLSIVELVFVSVPSSVLFSISKGIHIHVLFRVGHSTFTYSQYMYWRKELFLTKAKSHSYLLA